MEVIPRSESEAERADRVEAERLAKRDSRLAEAIKTADEDFEDFQEALVNRLDRIERKVDGALGGIAEIVPVTRELREFFNAVSSSPMAKRMLGKKKGGDDAG